MDDIETTGAPTGDTGVTDAGAQPIDAASPASAGAAAPAPQAAAPAPQQQGPDWNSLGVPFDQAKQYIEYMKDLNQRYSSDPVKAQQYDKWYNGEQQQQQHPYDWMTADEKRAEGLRQQGEQHPDWPRLQAEFQNFFQNPIGQLGQYVTHPKVQEAMFGAMAPQIQDLAQRMVQQQMQPIQQYLHQQGQQQFQSTYGKQFESLPPHIKAGFEKGIFGKGSQGIINAIEFSKLTPQQQADAAAGGAPQGPKPTADNRNTATTKTPSRQSAPSKDDEKDEDAKFDRELAAAWRGKKK